MVIIYLMAQKKAPKSQGFKNSILSFIDQNYCSDQADIQKAHYNQDTHPK